ncbi:hypothetical protein CYMTET_20675, partial [Cymbomonas tetramitiformis]
MGAYQDILFEGDIISLINPENGKLYIAASGEDNVFELLSAPDGFSVSHPSALLKVRRQGDFVGFSSAVANDAFLQPRRRSPHKLVFYSTKCGIWEEWEISGVSAVVQTGSFINVQVLTLRPRRIEKFQVSVGIIHQAQAPLTSHANRALFHSGSQETGQSHVGSSTLAARRHHQDYVHADAVHLQPTAAPRSVYLPRPPPAAAVPSVEYAWQPMRINGQTTWGMVPRPLQRTNTSSSMVGTLLGPSSPERGGSSGLRLAAGLPEIERSMYLIQRCAHHRLYRFSNRPVHAAMVAWMRYMDRVRWMQLYMSKAEEHYRQHLIYTACRAWAKMVGFNWRVRNIHAQMLERITRNTAGWAIASWQQFMIICITSRRLSQ